NEASRAAKWPTRKMWKITRVLTIFSAQTCRIKCSNTQKNSGPNMFTAILKMYRTMEIIKLLSPATKNTKHVHLLLQQGQSIKNSASLVKMSWREAAFPTALFAMVPFSKIDIYSLSVAVIRLLKKVFI